MRFRDLRETVWEANAALPRAGLVHWAQGNASGRDPDTGLVGIKPSGIRLDQLRVEDVVIVNADGTVADGNLKPSIDTASHLHVYRNRPDINGIVHTHSPYATSLAVRGEPIRMYTTTAAALFGEDIPVSGLATIGEEEIGKEIVEGIGQGSAILLRSHGVFTIGVSPGEALKYAVYVEEEAEIIHLAQLHGTLSPLDEEFVKEARRMYVEDYGQ